MTTAYEMAYVRKEEEPVLAPPRREAGALWWLRANLFSSVTNIVASILVLVFLGFVLPPLIRWAFIDAVWTGDRNACAAPGAGACWAFVTAKFQQFMYGRYPFDQRWRVDLTVILLIIGLIPMAIPRVPLKRENAIYLLLIFPIAATILLTGGHFDIPRDFIPALLVFAALATGIVAFLGAGRSAPVAAGLIAPAAALFPIALYATIRWFGPTHATVPLGRLTMSADVAALVLSMAVAVVAGVFGIIRTRGTPGSAALTTLWAAVGLIGTIAFFFGFDFRLPYVETPLWGGLMVTLVVAIVGIVASMPIGVLLALGRRSQLPIIRFCSVTFIEFVRGVPLITVLFMASVMLPLFKIGRAHV